MRHVLSIFLLIAVSSASIADITGEAAATCTSAQFMACSYTLANFVGLNTTLTGTMFKDYTIMYNQFLSLFGSNPGSTAGPRTVCNGLEQFNGCMYTNKGCITLQNLASNTDLQNAFFVGGTLNMYQFNCGPGLNTLQHEGLQCSQRVLLNYQNTLQMCVSTYKTSITHDAANSCKYVNNLINCWSSPFQTAPCRRAQAADLWWACEANRVFTLNQFPNCGVSCDVKFGSPSLVSFMEDHHKIVEGEHWFKIPDYMDKIDGVVTLVEGPWMNN